jgi:Polysulphide reductase, NrfD
VNSSSVTKEGLQDTRPGRDAPPGTKRPARKRRAAAEGGDSYYGLPVLNKPVWEAREIAGYFFLGGLAGASSVVALSADLTGRPELSRGAKTGAAISVGLSLAALVTDLGRPARFANMLRVVKPTSPMNIGSWLLSAYGPAAMTAAGCSLTGWFPRTGRAATVAAAVLGPAIASYTGVLISDTAVPAWHDAHRVMPFLFTASAATAAAGLGLACAGPGEAGPMSRLAVTGAVGDLIADRMLERELESVVYKAYDSSTLLKASKVLSAAGAAGAVAGSRSRALRIASGLALLAASACTRFGVFRAGIASAQDPQATVEPQRRFKTSPASLV